MSLYYETATILANPDKTGGSFKARIFKKKDLKSSPGQIYALVAEASKWSIVLKDVIEKCGLLAEEKKVPLCRNLSPLFQLTFPPAHTSPRSPPYPRSPPLQGRRRRKREPRPQARYYPTQSPSECRIYQSAHTPRTRYGSVVQRSHQQRRAGRRRCSGTEGCQTPAMGARQHVEIVFGEAAGHDLCCIQ
jgi:hypothetical protein